MPRRKSKPREKKTEGKRSPLYFEIVKKCNEMEEKFMAVRTLFNERFKMNPKEKIFGILRAKQPYLPILTNARMLLDEILLQLSLLSPDDRKQLIRFIERKEVKLGQVDVTSGGVMLIKGVEKSRISQLKNLHSRLVRSLGLIKSRAR